MEAVTVKSLENLQQVVVTTSHGFIADEPKDDGDDLGGLRASALALVATSSWAAPGSWNQERATKVAGELATAIGEARTAMGKLNPPPMGTSGRRAFHAAKDDARILKNSTRLLAANLEKGEGFDETFATYRRIRSIRRDLAENLQQAGMIPDDVLAKIDKCRDLVFQLSRYYEGD